MQTYLNGGSADSGVWKVAPGAGSLVITGVIPSPQAEHAGIHPVVLIFRRYPRERSPTTPESVRLRGRAAPADHSHSIVPGGLEVMSRVTRLTSTTSLVIRVEMVSRTS